MKTLFDVKELPLSQFEAIGVYHDKQLLLSPSQIQALLSGRRTDLISLHELKGEDFLIERLDARLSLRRQDSGELELFIHPIYKQPRLHPLLNQQESEDLISGKRNLIGKSVEQEEGRSTMLNIEYDPLTRDFVGYDVSKVQAPDQVNGMLLSQEEKSAFQRGDLLELADGTRLMHRASEPKGMLLLRGINALSKNVEQRSHRTPAFNDAILEMEGARKSLNRTAELQGPHLEHATRKMSR
ncbi:DUF4099 domain-containing protein [bacterium]|nr:MAG: DUF4099 domain-containing protein [bacterium]